VWAFWTRFRPSDRKQCSLPSCEICCTIIFTIASWSGGGGGGGGGGGDGDGGEGSIRDAVGTPSR